MLRFGTAGLRGPMTGRPRRNERRHGGAGECRCGRMASGTLPRRRPGIRRPRRAARFGGIRHRHRGSLRGRGILCAGTCRGRYPLRCSPSRCGNWARWPGCRSPPRTIRPPTTATSSYLDGGSQLIPPADGEIERCIDAVTEPIARTAPAAPPASLLSLPGDAGPAELGEELLRRYLTRAAAIPEIIGGPADDRIVARRRRIRIALTPMHGVGGETAVAALRRCGFPRCACGGRTIRSGSGFPDGPFPNPEEPGAADLLVKLAEEIDADLAIALDPDADRCALGVRGPTGMADAARRRNRCPAGRLRAAAHDPGALVATTVVSSRLLGALAPGPGRPVRAKR